MVCVVSATWRRHVGMSPFSGKKIPDTTPTLPAKLKGASYKIEHCSTKKRKKRHASDLSPYPAELLPLQPLDGADNQFGQINRKIMDDPFIQAGIKGFQPSSPFRAPSNFLSADTGKSFHWPTLAEMNNKLFPYPWLPDDAVAAFEEEDMVTNSPGFYTGPPPSKPHYSAPGVPPANVLVQRIIASSDKLFFISHHIGSGDKVCVAFDATMSLYSSCAVDGRYLVDFYLPHPSDSRYNAINK